MKVKYFVPLLLVPLLCMALNWQLFAKSAPSVGQTQIGAGNATATTISQNSPLVQSSRQFILQQLGKVQNSKLKLSTIDAVNHPTTCIAHRIGVGDAQKEAILQNLKDAGLVNVADDGSFPGGLKAGVFPPVLNDGTECPQLPQPFYAAPGSAFGSHHSYPGGLVVHESFNDISDINFAAGYRRVYGTPNPQNNGLPSINLSDSPNSETDIQISNDVIIAAPIWHDWAKPIVFQWNSDGTEFQELNFGGNGQTDNYGNSGDSRTGGHHIISLAESMKRGLSPDVVITQASAHSAPTLGNEYKVVNWLRSAAILAQIDPVAGDYLYRDSKGNLRLPPLRRLGDLDLNAAGQTNLLVEYGLHNLSDADFVLSIPAVSISEVLLKNIAPQFGYDPADAAKYNNGFRNPVLSYLSAERLLIIYGNSGLSGVTAEVNKLRQQQPPLI